MPRSARGMSNREVLNLPVAFPLDEANRALGIGRSNGYAMAKAGTYPIKVLRLGKAYRCRRSDLLEFLGIAEVAVMERPSAAPGSARASLRHLRSV